MAGYQCSFRGHSSRLFPVGKKISKDGQGMFCRIMVGGAPTLSQAQAANRIRYIELPITVTPKRQPGRAGLREIAPLRYLPTSGSQLLFPTGAVAAPVAGDVAG